jgi:hypothetical protein
MTKQIPGQMDIYEVLALINEREKTTMKIEELARHIESFPAGSDVDVHVADNGARFLVATPSDDFPLYLMLAGPDDAPPPAPDEQADDAVAADE